MKEKKIQNGDIFNNPVTVGFVGHISIDALSKLKEAVGAVKEFDLVFFKTSSGRLWIKEGDPDE